MKENNIQFLIAALSSNNDWISAQVLASYLHTTTRSVRNYVTEVNKRYSAPVILTSHRGYKWDGSFKASSPFLQQEDSFDTPEDRRQHILRELCFLNTENDSDALTFEVLSEEMAVSDRTLADDINEARIFCKEHRLTLAIRKETLFLQGKESDIRTLIYDLISLRHSSLSSELLQKIYPAIPVNKYSIFLTEILKNHGLHVDAYHIYPLFLRIIIQVMRIENQHSVTMEEVEIPDIEKYREYSAAEEILEKITRHQGFNCGWWEKYYLTILLICMCSSASPMNDTYETDTSSYVESFLVSLENHDRISYHEEHFPERMKDFIVRLKIACCFHISVKNPLRSSLRNYSPVLHDYSCWIMAGFKERFHLQPDRDQIAFFDMLLLSYRRNRKSRHFDISCTLILPEYFGLEAIIKNKIDDHFHKLISIDHVLNSCEISLLPKSDLYISLLPIHDRPHSVIISPALTAENYRSIQNEISLVEKEMRYKNFEIYLRSYSKEEFFERNHSFSSKEQVIEYICKKLEKEHYISPDFSKDILNREEIDSTSYHNLIAVPHAITKNVYKNVIYVLLNDKAISWGERKVNMVIFTAMERQLNDDFELFLDVLIRLFESKNNMKLLLETDSYHSFLEKLERIWKGII